jgi:RND family efflux transporter MFP subunit
LQLQSQVFYRAGRGQFSLQELSASPFVPLRLQPSGREGLGRGARVILAPGHEGGFPPAYVCIKAFSETDQTEDLKKVDVPTLIIHGDDDQIVPPTDSGLLQSKIVKGAILKVNKGAPHGLCTTLKDQVNEDLLAFLKAQTGPIRQCHSTGPRATGQPSLTKSKISLELEQGLLEAVEPRENAMLARPPLRRPRAERSILMSSTDSAWPVGLGLLLGAVAGLAGCSAPPEAPATGAPTVTVSKPLKREVTDYEEYTGRTAAVDSVQVVARVTGYLKEIHFKEGAEVKKEDVLYEIDPRPYKAAYDSAVALAAQNKASLKLAQENNERFKSLAKKTPGAVTPQDLDKYQSTEEQAAAAVAQSLANLETATLNLGWTKVTAPVTGRIGRFLVTQGNLIVADQTTLTTIVSQDPMYAYFDVDEPAVLRVKDLIREGKVAPYQKVRYPVFLGLVLETDRQTQNQLYPHEGHIDFVNNQLDQATATLQVRAVFDNPAPPRGDRLLTPGMFVRVRVPVSIAYPALLVTQAAIAEDQDLKYLYVVDEHNQVVRHNVKLGTAHEGLQVIAEGLQPEERVIVSGIQRVRRGAIVSPHLEPMPIPTRDALPLTPRTPLKPPTPEPKK